ncbi:MAG TPA: hypothetical protein VF228_01260 [Iamia sp.]
MNGVRLAPGPTATATTREAVAARLAGEPAYDLHTHIPLAGRQATLAAVIPGVPPAPARTTWGELEAHITTHLTPHLRTVAGFEAFVAAGFAAAADDGVSGVEATLSLAHARKYGDDPTALAHRVRALATETAPGLGVRLFAGLRREYGPKRFARPLAGVAAGGGFDGVDLTGDELAGPVEDFAGLFATARAAGLHTRAHVGEHGPAASVRRAVEVLDLDAVQHGITAAGDPETVRWLARRGTVLHVAPASNAVLRGDVAADRRRLRRLLDGGVVVTVGSDDLLLFDASVREQVVDLVLDGTLALDEGVALLRAGARAWGPPPP